MARPKKSLFEWLTGDTNPETDYSFDDLQSGGSSLNRQSGRAANTPTTAHQNTLAREQEQFISRETEPEGELAVDVYQTPTHIIIRAMIAGVRPEDLDVSITRDQVIIRGKRERHTESAGANFFFQELYWGSFTRTISLPQEVIIEEAEATERHGLLTVRLSKIDKGRQAKLKVKSN